MVGQIGDEREGILLTSQFFFAFMCAPLLLKLEADSEKE